MTRQSHIVIGIFSANLLGLPILPALFTSTLPDIDNKWNKYVKAGQGSLFNSHRGITHHAILGAFLLIMFAFSYTFGYSIIASLLIGYLSHLFVDTFTYAGIPYWKNKDRFSFKLFATGSTQEYLFVGFIVISISLLMFYFEGIYYFIPDDIVVIKELINYL